jgi:hypothetical protein
MVTARGAGRLPRPVASNLTTVPTARPRNLEWFAFVMIASRSICRAMQSLKVMNISELARFASGFEGGAKSTDPAGVEGVEAN